MPSKTHLRPPTTSTLSKFSKRGGGGGGGGGNVKVFTFLCHSLNDVNYVLSESSPTEKKSSRLARTAPGSSPIAITNLSSRT